MTVEVCCFQLRLHRQQRQNVVFGTDIWYGDYGVEANAGAGAPNWLVFA